MKLRLLALSTLALSALLCACNPASPSGPSAAQADSLRADSVRKAEAAADSAKSAARLAQADPKVNGHAVDESHGDVDWGTAKQGGVDFVYLRATKGSSTVDAKFKRNWDAARREGIPTGPLHHFTIGNDNASQLKNFQKQFTLEGADLSPAVRIDGGSIPPNVRIDRKAALKAMTGFLVECEKAFGCKPVLLTSPDFADNYFTDPAITAYPLWIESIQPTAPRMPKAWEGKTYTYWTYSMDGTIPGFSGNVARSEYHGTGTEFTSEAPCSKP